MWSKFKSRLKAEEQKKGIESTEKVPNSYGFGQPGSSTEAGSSSSYSYAPPPQSQYAHEDNGPAPVTYSQQSQASAVYADAPPSYNSWKVPEHDWQSAVPDTSTFEPPPAVFNAFDDSPTSNATEEEATIAKEWCERNSLWHPMHLDDMRKAALSAHHIDLIQPPRFIGTMKHSDLGQLQVHTAPLESDQCLFGYPPLYVVNEHAGRPRVIYYEVKILTDSPCNSIALGFAALPYPNFRLPGWNRGSLAIHGDDGRRYINDPWGGKNFTDDFCRGDTYGIGMSIKPMEAGRSPLVDVIFTRNGRLVSGWNIHEERDSERELPVSGLEGFHDLSAAIGTYDAVKFEVNFEPSKWLYNLEELQGGISM